MTIQTLEKEIHEEVVFEYASESGMIHVLEEDLESFIFNFFSTYLSDYKKELVERLKNKKQDIKEVHEFFKKRDNNTSAYDYAAGRTDGINRGLDQAISLIEEGGE